MKGLALVWPRADTDRDLVNSSWRLLGSVRLAIVQLALLCAALVIGSLVPQAPEEVRAGATPYSEWLEDRRENFGDLTSLMSSFSLFNVYHSWWFRLLLISLGVSLSVYVLGRMEGALTRRSGSVADFRLPGNAREHLSLLTTSSKEQAVESIEKALRSLGYVPEILHRSTATHLQAIRHPWHKLAVLGSHLGVAVVLIGALGGSLTGFSDQRVMVPEGATVELEHDTDLALRNNRFEATWYPDVDVAKDYVTNVTLLHNGKPVRENVDIRVNSPLSYDGTRVHQSFYGPAVDLRIMGAGGETLYAQGVALPYRDAESRPAGLIRLPGYELWVFAPRLDSTDLEVRPGQVRLRLSRTGADKPVGELNATTGEPVIIGGLSVLFERERQFSGFKVTRNAFVPWVWGGVVLTLLGTLYVFYFPRREVRIRIEPQLQGARVVLVAVGGRAMGRSQEWQRVVRAVNRALAAEGNPLQATTVVEGTRDA